MSRFNGIVKDLSSKGLGVVDHPDGRAFFVRGVYPGDEGEFEITKEKKRYGFARLIELSIPSDKRQDVKCKHFGFNEGRCGGCPWMGLDYQEQLNFKKKFLEFSLQKNGVTAVVNDIWASEKVYGYRSRAQLKTDGRRIGYVTPESKKIAPIEDCVILTEKNRQSLNRLYAQLPNNEWKAKPPYLWSLVDLDDEQDDFKINKMHPFRQANEGQNTRMKIWLADQLRAENSGQKVLELFCGSGNFTQVICDAGFNDVTGLESSGSAIATFNQKFHGRAFGLAIDLFKQKSWRKLFKLVEKAELLLLDPPREGFEDIDSFVAPLEKLRRILYISCDISTFSRDVEKLVKGGWTLDQAQPVDQFPHTPHLEILASLSKI